MWQKMTHGTQKVSATSGRYCRQRVKKLNDILGCLKRNARFNALIQTLQIMTGAHLFSNIFSTIINNTLPSCTQGMEAVVVELGRTRLEEVVHPNFHRVDVFELLLSQDMLHRSKHMIIRRRDVRAVRRMEQNGPAQFVYLLMNELCDVDALSWMSFVVAVSTPWRLRE